MDELSRCFKQVKITNRRMEELIWRHMCCSVMKLIKYIFLMLGRKGANLGEMTKAGFPVPQGFCVTTWAYRTFIQTSNKMNELFDLLDQVNHDDLEQIRILGHRIREHLESLVMPSDIKSSIL